MKVIEVPDSIRDGGERALRERVKRLGQLLDLKAPVWMMATELDLIESALWLLDPNTMGDHLSSKRTAEARASAGVCTMDLGCDGPVERDSACGVHAQELDDFINDLETREQT